MAKYLYTLPESGEEVEVTLRGRSGGNAFVALPDKNTGLRVPYSDLTPIEGEDYGEDGFEPTEREELEQLGVRVLKAMAKERGVEGYYTMNKQALIDSLLTEDEEETEYNPPSSGAVPKADDGPVPEDEMDEDTL